MSIRVLSNPYTRTVYLRRMQLPCLSKLTRECGVVNGEKRNRRPPIAAPLEYAWCPDGVDGHLIALDDLDASRKVYHMRSDLSVGSSMFAHGMGLFVSPKAQSIASGALLGMFTGVWTNRDAYNLLDESERAMADEYKMEWKHFKADDNLHAHLESRDSPVAGSMERVDPKIKNTPTIYVIPRLSVAKFKATDRLPLVQPFVPNAETTTRDARPSTSTCAEGPLNELEFDAAAMIAHLPWWHPACNVTFVALMLPRSAFEEWNGRTNEAGGEMHAVIGVFANRNISPGEEIAFDYGWTAGSDGPGAFPWRYPIHDVVVWQDDEFAQTTTDARVCAASHLREVLTAASKLDDGAGGSIAPLSGTWDAIVPLETEAAIKFAYDSKETVDDRYTKLYVEGVELFQSICTMVDTRATRVSYVLPQYAMGPQVVVRVRQGVDPGTWAVSSWKAMQDPSEDTPHICMNATRSQLRTQFIRREVRPWVEVVRLQARRMAAA